MRVSRRPRRLLVAAFVAWLASRAAIAERSAAPKADQSPKPTTLTESVEKRLVQLDVAVEGDRDAIRAIKAEDFALYVGTHEVTGLIVDPLCDEPSAPEPAAEAAPSAATPQPKVAPQVTRPRATFIFFFDQPHLTQAGREFSLATTKDLINRLVVDGGRASIVSNARSLQTIVPMTGDREKLLAGLVRLRGDLRQWDSYATTEVYRADEVVRALTPEMQCLIAKGFAQEEWQEARRSMIRIGYTVGALADLPAPKALVYFGDSLRQKAGLHYLGLPPADACPERVSAELVPSAAYEFDAVIDEALARGVHFFTIQAEGLTSVGGSAATGPDWNTLIDKRRRWETERLRHAQDALVGLAAETGGEAFLGGASNKYITDRIAAVSSCRLLLSFPPGDLPRDKALSVTMELHVPKVKIHAQGRIVIPSQASIEQARLMAAFVDPASSDDGSLRVLLIPRGGDGKVWKVAVQLRLRPSGLPDNSAELGASIVRHDAVVDHFSGSIATRSASRAIVLEKRLDMAPGVFSVVAVARDAKRGDIGATRLEADWPSPAKSAAAIAPIAVLQAAAAAMSKDDIFSATGSLARDVDEPVEPSAGVTLETVVCRGAKTKAPIVVERSVEDGLPNEFVPMTIDPTGDACVQIVDVVRGGRLRPGVVDYRVTARLGDEIVAQERRALRVGSGVDGR
jgi:hypothetical protein